MPQCAGTKRNGGECTATVNPGEYFCWWHNPANTAKRQRIASKGGRSKVSRVSKDLHQLLSTLTEKVLDGTVEPYPASVAGSLVGVRLRLLEYERRVQEQTEVIERLDALEEAASRKREQERRLGRRQPWGG